MEILSIFSRPAKAIGLPLESYAGHPYPRMTLMDYKAWVSIRDNDRQRDTAEHAKKAGGKHLAAPQQSHVLVHAAILPNGEMVKLDGHTRTYLWELGILPKPKMLSVVVWPVADNDEAKELYTHHDNQNAVETVHDQVAGGIKEHRIEFMYAFCQRRRFANALRYACGFPKDYSVYDAIGEWQGELLQLDGLNVNQRQFNSGITLAFLLSAASDSEAALDFWTRYKTTDGKENDFGICPIRALKIKVEQIMTEGGFGGGRDRMFAIAQHALWCFEKFKENRAVMLRKSGRRGSISISDYRAMLGFAS